MKCEQHRILQMILTFNNVHHYKIALFVGSVNLRLPLKNLNPVVKFQQPAI